MRYLRIRLRKFYQKVMKVKIHTHEMLHSVKNDCYSYMYLPSKTYVAHRQDTRRRSDVCLNRECKSMKCHDAVEQPCQVNAIYPGDCIGIRCSFSTLQST